MEIKKVFIERLKEAINEKRISQNELAKKANVSTAYISQLLSGKKNPTIKVVKQIADALGLPVSYFLENGVEISIYLRRNKNLTEEDIKAIEAFVDYLIERKNANKSLLEKFPKGNPPYQVDVLKALEYYVKKENIFFIDFSDGVCGFTVFIDGEPNVLINKKQNQKRIHWTIAHELAEVLLHRDSDNRPILFSLNALKFDDDWKANKFASEMLMPEEILKGYVDSFLETGMLEYKEEFIERLSEHFKVSTQALKWRLKDLGYNEL